MVAPLGLASRLRPIVRLSLAGYSATTILAWAIQGPFYSTAYVAKAIELVLIVLLAIEFVRSDDDLLVLIRRELRSGLAHLRGGY